MEDKKVISLNKRDVEEALEDIIDSQVILMKIINSSSAYTRTECEDRVEQMQKRSYVDDILRQLGIQSFEYFDRDYKIEIV